MSATSSRNERIRKKMTKYKVLSCIEGGRPNHSVIAAVGPYHFIAEFGTLEEAKACCARVNEALEVCKARLIEDEAASNHCATRIRSLKTQTGGGDGN